MLVQIKRAYEKPEPGDGYRVLVDGLWPRGQSKAKLKIDEWMRDLAPSASLRKWYGHEPEKWEEFRKRYRQELSKSPRKELLEQLIGLARNRKLTMVFGAQAAGISNAAVLQEIIRGRLERPRRAA